MTVPILSGSAIVGKFYMVPCVRLVKARSTYPHGHPAAGQGGWIPVIGSEHHDRDTIGFQPMHIHVDVRFLTKSALEQIYTPLRNHPAEQQAMTLPVSTYSDGVACDPIKCERAARRMLCKREMPDFPQAPQDKWRDFEKQYSACKLKPGNICPHRGIDLTPFVKEDGTVVCPGHGLKWDTKTGDLLPHHARAA